MQTERLTPVYESNDVGRAEVIRAALEEAGIPCSIENAHQAGFTGVLTCRLHVLENDVAAAEAFIAEHEYRA